MDESDVGRGPRFREVVLALEEQLNSPGVSDAMLLHCFGPPDLWEENKSLFVYFFDQEEAGRNGMNGTSS